MENHYGNTGHSFGVGSLLWKIFREASQKRLVTIKSGGFAVPQS